MNFVDFAIIVVIFAYLVNYFHFSFAYYLLTTSAALIGFLLAITLAPKFLSAMGSNLRKGTLALALIFGLAALFYVAGAMVARKLKIRIIESRFYKADKLLAFPYKLLASSLMVLMTAQCLIYIPILSLQYMAQGSSLIYATNKFIPEFYVGNKAKKIAPNQFKSLRPDYDPDPLTYENIGNAGQFQKAVDRVSPSVVKVSGRTCTGLGFGSGFVAESNYVVTNAHVVDGASTIYVSDHDGTYPMTPVLIDRDMDIAILYSRFINGKPLPILNEDISLGTDGVILGYPGGSDLNMSHGQTNNSHSNFVSETTKLSGESVINITAQSAKGNSGGPVIDTEGRVIGVVTGGDATGTIMVKPEVVYTLVQKAKSRIFPTRTGFCQVGIQRF